MPIELPVFPCAPSDLLEQRRLLRRVDLKFLVPRARLVDVLQALTADYAIVKAGENHIASYDTVYFDTPDLESFHQHRRGRLPRYKVRVRHYPDREVSFFEIKTRRTPLLSDKCRVERPHGDSSLSTADRRLAARLTGLTGTRLKERVRIQFRRVSLIGVATPERVTVDFDVQLGSVALRKAAIVEVKLDPRLHHTPALYALRSLGFRSLGFSKYCMGTVLGDASLPQVRFSKTLRQLEVVEQ